jgi:hypothetical protein
MPVDQLPNRRAASSPGDARLVKYDQYIDEQIRATRRTVKAVDLAAALVALASGVLAYLLAFALVEHWLVPSGFSVAVRYLLFAVLVGWTGVFAYRQLWPLVWRAINPVYAARTIEQSSPTLKNTLVNLLLFRERRSDVSDAVYHTLEEQAAQRLTRVPVDAAVDRGHLIRLGYVMVGVVAFAAFYKMLSPRDPFVSAERVLLAWADIVPASRVKIGGVTPGDITIARGEFVDISADVRGIGENDAVTLKYTTADGQAVDKGVPMSSPDGGFRFQCRIPATADATGLVGAGQNLTYRIEAGDARSQTFDVTVVSAPAIIVQRIEYDFPDYTGEVDRTVDGSGDLRAIEGTRVTIHARANGPVEEGYVDFEADGRRDLKLHHEGDRAKASFVLALRDDRKTPAQSKYVLRFTNVEGRTNRNPVKHPIEVLRDFDPELTLIAPREKTLDVRLDETVTMEVDARDPDFALSEVRLHGEAVGRPGIDVPLLAQTHVGRFTGRYQFTPREHQLRAGDVVQYWITAKDNRTPTANTAHTERQTLRIVSADPAKPPQERIAQNQRRPQQPQGDGRQDEKQGGDQNQQGDNQRGGRSQNRGGQSAATRGERGEKGSEPQRGEQAQPGERSTPNEQNENKDNNASGGAAGERTQQGQDQSQDKQAEKQPGESAADGQPSDLPSTSEGSRSNPSRGSRAGGQRGGEPNPEDSPVSSDGDNDSEAFERIREHLKERRQLPEDTNPSPANQSESKEPSSREAQPSENAGAKQDSKSQPQNGQDKSTEAPGESKQPAERRDGDPSSGGRETNTKEPTGKADQPGEDQRTRDGKSAQKSDQQREQTPSGQSSDADKNEGSPGRSAPDSVGNEGGKLPDDTKDSVANKQVNRDGAGSTGQSEAAEKGAGEATERGAGNDSQTAGRDVNSAEKTGQPGSETPGRGSGRREGQGTRRGGERGDTKGEPSQTGGERGAGAASDQQQKSPEAASKDESKKAGESASENGARRDNGQGNRNNGSPSRGADGKSPAGESASDQKSKSGYDSQWNDGKPGGSDAPARGDDPSRSSDRSAGSPTGDGGAAGTPSAPRQQGSGEVPDADAANVEYARKQTDLVLERLSEQLNRKQVDKGLLEKLGWTEEDMRKFVARWQQRKEAARRNDPTGEAARKELDDALRSLGLRSAPLRPSQSPDDKLRELQQGQRGAIPLEYRDRLRAYNQGVSRSRNEGAEK